MERLENLSYEEYRNIAKDGDVIFLRGSQTSLIQRLIMFATGSVHCHVAFAFWVMINDRPRLMLVESQGNTRRRILTASYYKARTIDVIRAPIPWGQICDNALSEVGQAKYSKLDAIWVGIRELAWNEFKIHLPMINKRGEICSEFIARLV